MKKAFTMVEVIFVIVIIGILASVAIPKLAASRNDAEASACTSEIGQLINGISTEYTKMGYAIFKSTTISDMTNIRILSEGDSEGIKIDTTVDTTGITYVCGNVDIVTIVGESAGSEYNLTVTVTTGTNPVSQIVAQEVIENIIGGSSSKIFVL